MIEQKQFQGSAESKGFKPVEQTSYIPLLEKQHENYRRDAAIVGTSIANNGRIKEAEAESNWRALAGFSETLQKQISDHIDKKNAADEEEGLMLAFTEGVPEEQMKSLDEQEAQLIKSDAQARNIAGTVEAEGSGPFVGQMFRELSGWKAYGYVRGLAMKGGANYPIYYAQAAANTSVIINGQEVTLNTASNPAERAAVEAQIRRGYLRQYLGINPALLNKYAFPGMREVDGVQLNQWRKQEIAKQQDAMIGEAQELFGADPVKNFQGSIDLLVRSGRFGRAEARDQLLKDITDPDMIDSIGETMSWDGVKSWAEKYPIQWAAARREAIRRESSDYETDRIESQTEGRRWADQVIEEWEQNAPSDEVIEQVRRKMDDDFGFIDPRLERWVNRTTDAEATKYYQDYFDKLDRAGQLTEDKVNDPSVPSSVRNSFLARAQAQDKARTDTPEFKQYGKQLEEDLKRVASQNSLEPGAPGLELATAKAQADFQRYYMAAIQGGAVSPADAAAQAYARVSQDIQAGVEGKGSYAFSDTEGFTNVLPKGFTTGWEEHRAAINRLLDENKLSALDRNALIPKATLQDAIENANNPGYMIPPIAQHISDLTGGTVSPWQVLERQAIAQGLGALKPNERVQQVTQGMTPQMTRLLHYKPSYRRVSRSYASTGSFDVNRIPRGYGPTVLQAASQYGIDPAILAGLIEVESTWNKDARSEAGAIGIAQIVPKWHPTVDATNAVASIHYAAKYLSELQAQLGSIDEAIYAYNGGPGGIRKSQENREYHPKVLKAAAKYGFNPTGNAWSNPALLNPRLAYITSGIGPTSTGPHLDVKRVDGGNFGVKALDPYVAVDDPKLGRVPLSRVGTSDGQAEHRARGSHGIDYLTAEGTRVYLKGGARVISSVKTEHGEKLTIQLPNGQKYTFLHGRRA